MAQQNKRESRHEPEAERREARAQRILDAASTLILRYGYDKTRSIEEICSTLGISRASFYRYLKDARQEEA